MNNKITFFIDDLPEKEMQETLGITKRHINNMPLQLLEPLLGGYLTPLIQINTSDPNIVALARIRLKREQDGRVSLQFYPRRGKVTPHEDVKYSEKEIEALKRGEVIIKKMPTAGGFSADHYVQMDMQTRHLEKVLKSDVTIPDTVKGIELSRQQRNVIKEGKPIEITLGDRKMTVGINIFEPTGFEEMHGSMEDWKQKNLIAWDFVNPDKVGFWHTDENDWQYAQSMKRYLHMEKPDIQQEQKQEQQQKRSISNFWKQ